MNREILFKAKRLDTGEWVEGDLYHYDNCFDGVIIYPKTIDRTGIKVDPKTVSQFTGITDRNNVKIFENDIVDGFYGRNYVIKYEIETTKKTVSHGYSANCIKSGFEMMNGNKLIIRGNIFDNSELADAPNH